MSRFSTITTCQGLYTYISTIIFGLVKDYNFEDVFCTSHGLEKGHVKDFIFDMSRIAVKNVPGDLIVCPRGLKNVLDMSCENNVPEMI